MDHSHHNGRPSTSDGDSRTDPQRGRYKRLFRRFVLLTLFCSLLPLLVVGWGINGHYTRFARARMMNAFRNEVVHHRQVIELFIQEQRSKLELIARTHDKKDLTLPGRLEEVFELMNREGWSITDLGVIDGDGRHLAYIGPYDLLDKNYAQTLWFKKVMENGIYISDMFLGFRQEPHFIIAVTGNHGKENWILRATVDTEAFRSLVENVHIGQTGAVYLLNSDGVFQTSPRFSGRIMDKSDFPVPPVYDGIRIQVRDVKTDDGRRESKQVMSLAWLEEPRWLLVVKQDFSEAFADVNHANVAVMVFLHLSALSILLVAILVSRHMISIIRRRDAEADGLNRQLAQTSKLASIGQLSAGVAHEINNPLAIILTEKQLLVDAMQHGAPLAPAFRDQLVDSTNQIDVQVQRCKRITTNLLRFARRTESHIETVHLNAFIEEVIDLMDREARCVGIRFDLDLDAHLPPLLSDPSQLQQVLLNMVTNAIDAHEDRPGGRIAICTATANGDAPPLSPGIWVTISDTGKGIAAEHLEKIFDPFFTTKAVGKGTGLGLSICYSIIKRLGGGIQVKSSINEGTAFTIFLPLRPPADLLAEAAGDPQKATGTF